MSTTSLVKRTRSTLWAGSLLVTLLVGSVVFIAIDANRKIANIMTDTRRTTLLHRVESDLYRLRQHELGFFVEIADAAARSREQGKWARAHDDLDHTLAEINALDRGATQTNAALVGDISTFSTYYAKVFERVSAEALGRSPLTTEAIVAYERQLDAAQERASALTDTLKTAIVSEQADNERRERQIEREMMWVMIVSISLGVLAILVLLALSAFVPARLTSALAGLTLAIDEVSLGKRSSPVTPSGISDFQGIEQAMERLRISVNGMLQRLVQIS